MLRYSLRSCSQLKQQLQGRPHMYKGLFWRLQGSHHLPRHCPCHHRGALTTPPAAEGNVCRPKPLHNVPVEMVDINTCKVIHTFATAREAHRSVSGSACFASFKDVLMGQNGNLHCIYKGYLFRFVGSDKVPPKGYRYTGKNTISLHDLSPSQRIQGGHSRSLSFSSFSARRQRLLLGNNKTNLQRETAEPASKLPTKDSSASLSPSYYSLSSEEISDLVDEIYSQYLGDGEYLSHPTHVSTNAPTAATTTIIDV